MSIAEEKYVSLTTFRRNGEGKAVPVWIVDLGDGAVGFTTSRDAWKLKRLRNDPRVELRPCDRRGVVAEGAPVTTGSGREATAEEYTRVKAAVADKYGLMLTLIELPSKVMRLFGREAPSSNAAVIITLD
ncbi:MAG: PPOX class F420-dependent oxidoreductase [Actinomycetota bacterium]